MLPLRFLVGAYVYCRMANRDNGCKLAEGYDLSVAESVILLYREALALYP